MMGGSACVCVWAATWYFSTLEIEGPRVQRRRLRVGTSNGIDPGSLDLAGMARWI